MKAILLAAGLGTRLRPLTISVPKCLMPIGGRPLLDIWLEKLTKNGCGPFLINTHYLSEQVENFINQSQYKPVSQLVYEPVLLGTAGTLLRNLHFFSEKDGLLIHADNYCLQDFKGFIEAHASRPKECVMTMMTFRTENPSSCGIVEVDSNGVLVAFHEKPVNPSGNLANAAIYIISSELINILKEHYSHAKDFSDEIIGALCGRIYTFETSDFLIDIGSVESYQKANNFKKP